MARRKIRRILVPLDGSKTSLKGLETAVMIAKPTGAHITGLCVIPTHPPIPVSELQDSFKIHMTDGAAKVVADARKIVIKNEIKFHGKLVYGSASVEIANFANDRKYDLVVIASRGRGDPHESILGSVVNSTIHRSHVPVLVAR